MASQLIVKSQAAISWGGKTIWVLQDQFADYISASTALDLRKFISTYTDEVNILSFTYGDGYKTPKDEQTVSLKQSALFSGPIRAGNGETQPSFQDIVLASVCPPRRVLISALCKKALANRVSIQHGSN